MSQHSEIEIWNKERGLLDRNMDVNVVSTSLIEEVIELNYNVSSVEARELAKQLVSIIQATGDGSNWELTTPTQKVDALCDGQVYSIGATLQLGFDPTISMNETIKEISSRTGKIKDGKFEKYTTPEAKALHYKADYNKAKL